MMPRLWNKTVELRERIIEVLEPIRPTTVRSVAYKLLGLKVIPDMTPNSVHRVQRCLLKMREDGVVPWSWIVDPGRDPIDPGTYSSLASFLRSVPYWWRQDPWAFQPRVVEVWSEKQTVHGVLASTLDQYGVRVRYLRGYASGTVINDVTEYIDRIHNDALVILYVGDYDPSGLHMSEVDLPGRLEEYGAVDYEVKRVALTRDDHQDLREFSLPVKTKTSDPRYKWWTTAINDSRFTELDAMDPNDLRDRVAQAIAGEIDDPDAWDRVEAVNEEAKALLEKQFKRLSKSKAVLAVGSRYAGREA